MDVRRLIAQVDVAELNVAAFCREHGVGRTMFYEIRRRFETEGEVGLELRSRAPNVVANKTPIGIEDQIVRLRKELVESGLDAGPDTIRWHLSNEIDESLVPSGSTIWRILTDRGLVVADPSKRPSKIWKRFEADRANELFQIDGTDYTLETDQVVKIINVIDDGSRFCPASQAHVSESFDTAWLTLTAAFTDSGMCARVLSDNGSGFKRLTNALAALGIAKSFSSPFHPQTCGKVERFHQTQSKWLNARPPANSLPQLQVLLDQFRDIYNYRRPHRAIARQTPATRWAAMPKTGPSNRPLDLETATAFTRRKVAANGTIAANGYMISIGAQHAHAIADTIITGTSCDVFIDGQHIRNLEIDPTQRNQNLYNRPGRPTKQAT